MTEYTEHHDISLIRRSTRLLGQPEEDNFWIYEMMIRVGGRTLRPHGKTLSEALQRAADSALRVEEMDALRPDGSSL